MSLPLLIPWNVVGTIWQVFGRVDIGLLGYTLAAHRASTTTTRRTPFDAWMTVIVMDVWHWTSLVALLAYAGLQSIPSAYYQAARIDQASRWSVFRYIELPKMKGVLLIAVLLRFMDSFMIYTEPFVVTGGGPGNADHLPVDRPREDGARAVRPRPGGGVLADVLPGDPAAELGVLHGDDQRR
jgi:glycerol transport system permease protein